jgi:ferredoxin
MAITKVWIDPGCILCSTSVDTCSAVFEIGDDAESAHVKTGVDLTQHEAEIKEAAENCPVEVIKYEEA